MSYIDPQTTMAYIQNKTQQAIYNYKRYNSRHGIKLRPKSPYMINVRTFLYWQTDTKQIMPILGTCGFMDLDIYISQLGRTRVHYYVPSEGRMLLKNASGLPRRKREV